MESRLQQLIEKYWEGESSLDEERELKALLNQTDQYPELRDFLVGVDRIATLETDMKLPGRKKASYSWSVYLRVAAVFLGGILLIGYGFTLERQRQQEAAYLQVVEAFQLIQFHMAKGTSELEVMADFRHLNTAGQLFNITETGEEK
ncbi:MAG: hypothetical protein JJU34_21085 [Lunatimonas sp.]|uniref:hypothetical protein n=1 Tax=Lunatimonas sp. TaxID=2060141 RepID=UPI00263A6866|nr:hypothetical protein [Lunatimonas sp.]MCC5939790.1 hypothetical protein [Lunatimonas sp.]